MNYIELLKTHWLFFVINLGIFVVALLALIVIFRLANRRQLRQAQLVADAQRKKILEQTSLKSDSLSEQARQIVAHLQRAQATELWNVAEKYYNLLSLFLPLQYLPQLEQQAQVLRLANLTMEERKEASEVLRQHLQRAELLQKALLAPVFVERFGLDDGHSAAAAAAAVQQERMIKKIQQQL